MTPNHYLIKSTFRVHDSICLVLIKYAWNKHNLSPLRIEYVFLRNMNSNTVCMEKECNQYGSTHLIFVFICLILMARNYHNPSPSRQRIHDSGICHSSKILIQMWIRFKHKFKYDLVWKKYAFCSKLRILTSRMSNKPGCAKSLRQHPLLWYIHRQLCRTSYSNQEISKPVLQLALSSRS